MKIFTVHGTPGPEGKPGEFFFQDQDGNLHECCGAHADKPHGYAVDASICFYRHAMASSEEYTCPATMAESECQVPACPRFTRSGLRNDLVPQGKYLCDEHRDGVVLQGMIPLLAGNYRIEKTD